MGELNRCVSLHSHHDGSWQRWPATQVAVGRRPRAGVPCSAPWRGGACDVRGGARRRRRSRSGSRTRPTAAGRSRRSHGLAVRVERGATDRASTTPIDTAQARSGQGRTGRPAHRRCSPRGGARVAARRLRRTQGRERSPPGTNRPDCPGRSAPRTQSCGAAPSREARPIQGLSCSSLRARPTVTERNETVHHPGNDM